MAQHKSAEKRSRISSRRSVRNKEWKSRMRTAIKRIRSLTEKEKAVVELRKTVKMLDRLAAKGIIHKNMAANNKSSLTKLVDKLK